MTQRNRHSMLMDWKKNIIKMSILPKAIYTLKAIPIKITPALFTVLEQTILNFYGIRKDPKIMSARVMLK